MKDTVILRASKLLYTCTFALFWFYCTGVFNNGVAGVLSYDIVDTDYKLAILYLISDSEELRYNVKVRQNLPL